MDQLVGTLRLVRRRLSLQQWSGLCVNWLLAAISAGCFWLLLTRLFPALGEPLTVCVAGLAVGLIAGTVFWIKARPGLVAAALEADRRLGLKERLTSSYELREAEGEMVAAVHRDARHALGRLNVGRDIPFRLPSSTPHLAIVVMFFGLAYAFFPEFDLLHYRERQAKIEEQEKALKLSATRLRSTVTPLKERATLEKGELAEIVDEVERVAASLESGQITEKQALARLDNLSQKLQAEREKMLAEEPHPAIPKALADMAKTPGLAQDIARGRYDEAGKKVQSLKEKMSKEGLSEDEKEKLAEEMKKLSETLGGENSNLGKALSAAAKELASSTPGASMNSLAGLEMSLADLESLMEQLGQLDGADFDMSQWKQGVLGPSKFCRNCGKPLTACDKIGSCTGCCPGGTCNGLCAACMLAGIGGNFAEGDSSRPGGGMGRRGQGRGGMVGDLPDAQVSFDPAMLSGGMTKGKILANILQRGAPDEGARSDLGYVNEAFTEVKREAEQALTKQEIPPGAREFVREYFGALEPENNSE